MDMKRLLVFGGIIIAVIAGLTIFTPFSSKKVDNTEVNLTVFVSTFSLLEAGRAVAGNVIEVRSVVPVGSDPHMFSPNPSQVAELSKSALFIYNGAGFETWAENMKKTLPLSVKVVDMSQFVTLQKNGEGYSVNHDEHAHESEHQDEHEHRHGGYDPHYWLDIDNMISMTRTLDREFSQLLPDKAERFHQNTAAYIAELEKLKGEFTQGLSECKNRILVSNHDAFGYLTRANKLETLSLIGLSSDEQPSAQTMAHVVETVKKHGIKTIFFEELVNDSLSRTIAKETGAVAESLQPLANISEDALESHQTYLSVMRENLKKLREAMECR